MFEEQFMRTEKNVRSHMTHCLQKIHTLCDGTQHRLGYILYIYLPDGYGPVSERRSRPQARAPRAVYIRSYKWVASSVGEFATSERRRRENRAP